MVYLCNNIFVLLEAYCLSHIKGIYSKRVFLAVCLLQLSLIIGLRDGVGADFYSYLKIYNYINGVRQYQYTYLPLEFGYELLNKICGWAGLPYWGLNLVCAFITDFFLVKAIKEFKCDPYLSVFLYISLFFFYHSMNQVRQGMAMTIGLYALSQLSKMRIGRFLTFLILALSFHTVAAAYLPLFFLRKQRVGTKTVCQYVFITVVIMLFWKELVGIINMTKYAHFVNSEYDMRLTISSIVNLTSRICLAVFALVNIGTCHDKRHYLSRKCKVRSRFAEYECNILCHMILLCTMFQVLTTFCTTFLGRVTTPYFMAYIIVFPKILENVHRNSKRKIYAAEMYLFGMFYQLVYYLLMGRAVLAKTYVFALPR